MPFFGLLYKALKKFLSPTALDGGEVDQPAPVDVRRAHLEQELKNLGDEPRYEADREP